MKKTEPYVEILELAIAREVAAYTLYTEFSARVEDSEIKKLFKRLADEELEHKARLELELIKLGIVVPTSEQLAAHGQAEDDTSVFDMDYKEMLLFAMDKERRSMRLYIDLAAMSKDKISREMLITLAEEEAMHAARFEVEYNFFMRKQK